MFVRWSGASANKLFKTELKGEIDENGIEFEASHCLLRNCRAA
jgi:hypothetical protein